MNKKSVIIMIAVLMLAIIGIWVLNNMEDLFPVSEDDSRKAVEDYKNNLEKLYTELNDTYNRLEKVEGNQEWENFSRDWMPRLIDSKPDSLDRKLSKEYEGKKAVLSYAHETLISLWDEYNKDFIGRKSESEKIEELKNAIEDIFNNVDV